METSRSVSPGPARPLPRLACALSLLLVLMIACRGEAPPEAGRGEVLLATTTSAVDTGLADALLPVFERETGYHVKVLSLGSGQALALAERGEADAVLSHSPEAEERLVSEGRVEGRAFVMENAFILVGPPEDPCGVRGSASVGEAMARIAAGCGIFVSRGDQSGTHVMEGSLWREAGIAPAPPWHQEAGQGMGATLRVASEKGAYTLTDRATYLVLRKGLRLEVLFQGDPRLRNVYHAMSVRPDGRPRVNAEGGRALVRFLTSEQGRSLIREFGVARYGEPLFQVEAEGAPLPPQ
jgi:tungstate transport system substrate-binding protein